MLGPTVQIVTLLMIFITLKRKAAQRGITLTNAIMGYDTWLDIFYNAKVRLGINPIAESAANVLLTDAEVAEYLKRMTGNIDNYIRQSI